MLALLLSLANDQQKSIFDQLYEQYKELVKYIALDIMKNEMHAEEVVQEVFLRLFLKIDDISDVLNFKTHGLVIIISRRVSYNKLKYEKRRAHESESYIENISLRNETTEDIALRNIEYEGIFSELSNLNKADFDLMTLRHYYGYSYDELEDYFNLSAETLRKRYQRSKVKIMAQYGMLRGDYNEEAR